MSKNNIINLKYESEESDEELEIKEVKKSKPKNVKSSDTVIHDDVDEVEEELIKPVLRRQRVYVHTEARKLAQEKQREQHKLNAQRRREEKELLLEEFFKKKDEIEQMKKDKIKALAMNKLIKMEQEVNKLDGRRVSLQKTKKKKNVVQYISESDEDESEEEEIIIKKKSKPKVKKQEVIKQEVKPAIIKLPIIRNVGPLYHYY